MYNNNKTKRSPLHTKEVAIIGDKESGSATSKRYFSSYVFRSGYIEYNGIFRSNNLLINNFIKTSQRAGRGAPFSPLTRYAFLWRVHKPLIDD
jgi:hypothetical protein